MSLLFHKKTKKAIQYIWIGLSILIILSMVITYTGLSRVSSQVSQDAQASAQPPQQENQPVAAAATSTASSTPTPVEKLPFKVAPN